MDPSLHLLWKNLGKICEHTDSEHVNAIDWRETCVASMIFKLRRSAPLFLPLIRSGSCQVGFVFYWNLLTSDFHTYSQQGMQISGDHSMDNKNVVTVTILPC